VYSLQGKLGASQHIRMLQTEMPESQSTASGKTWNRIC